MAHSFPPEFFKRQDERPDRDFYAYPRFVTHIDDAAIEAVTCLYKDMLPEGGRLLDLMSSWVSHLPDDIEYEEVVGLGMNGEELSRNPRLARFDVHDLNDNPRLPYRSSSFDAAMCCVSIDYLVRPAEVLRDVGRVLKPGAPFVVTFSNRCFPTKAVTAWLALDEPSRVGFVEQLFEISGRYGRVTSLDRSPGTGDPLYAVVGWANTRAARLGASNHMH
ncbi:MAG: methyltransferase domain-containing protein [Myxococcota bacterium]